MTNSRKKYTFAKKYTFLFKKITKMKKIALSIFALALCAISANAQRVIASDTQARMVEVTAKSYVTPLIVDLKVVGPRKTFLKSYSKAEVEIGMGASLNNLDPLRSRAIYDASSEKYKSGDGKEYNGWNCDAVVAAIFKVELSEDGKWYNVEMKGFPANFDQDSWHPIRQSDYEWMRIEKASTSSIVDKTSNQGTVISNIKK